MSEGSLMSDAITRSGLEARLVLRKAQETLRMLKIKLPAGTLKKAEMCRHLIAIEIACQVMGLPLDKPKLLAQASINAKNYQEALVYCRQALMIRSDRDTMQKLAVQYGSHLQNAANDVLEQYKRLYIEKLDRNRQALVNINSSVCQAAAFYIVGIRSKAKLTKAEVAAVAEVDVAHFSTVVDLMTKITKSKNIDIEKEDDEITSAILTSRKRALSEVVPKGQSIQSKKISSRGSYTTTNINGKEYRNYDSGLPCTSSSATAKNSGPDGKESVSEFPTDKNKSGGESGNVALDKTNDSGPHSSHAETEKENIANIKRDLYDKWKESKIENKMKLQ